MLMIQVCRRKEAFIGDNLKIFVSALCVLPAGLIVEGATSSSAASFTWLSALVDNV
jgi:hypothetical protein